MSEHIQGLGQRRATKEMIQYSKVQLKWVHRIVRGILGIVAAALDGCPLQSTWALSVSLHCLFPWFSSPAMYLIYCRRQMALKWMTYVFFLFPCLSVFSFLVLFFAKEKEEEDLKKGRGERNNPKTRQREKIRQLCSKCVTFFQKRNLQPIQSRSSSSSVGELFYSYPLSFSQIYYFKLVVFDSNVPHIVVCILQCNVSAQYSYEAQAETMYYRVYRHIRMRMEGTFLLTRAYYFNTRRICEPKHTKTGSPISALKNSNPHLLLRYLLWLIFGRTDDGYCFREHELVRAVRMQI